MPAVKLATVPEYLQSSGRAYETWKPLLMVASGLNDNDWLTWAFPQIQDAQDNLVDGHLYEEKQDILKALLKEFLLFNDGRVELRFKLPTSETQVAEKIMELSQRV